VTRTPARILLAALLSCGFSSFAAPASAWDGYGHRLITRLAVQNLREDIPAWVRDDASVVACSDGAQTPDRWRGVRVAQLKHLNDPDHYIDVEDLEPLGMTLRTMPPLRHEYVKRIALARSSPDFSGPPIDPRKDLAKTDEYPGFLPIAALETYGKIVSAFKLVRMQEALGKPGSQIEAAKWNARVHIGILAHYIGDAAQPLHTTKHHHGWVGDNPHGYTTDRKIHAYIDGEILKIHRIGDDDVRPSCDFSRSLDSSDLFGEVLAHVERSFAQMEPLYKLKLTGDLEKDEGKRFIASRLADGASMLNAMIEQAWIDSAPSPQETQDLIKFEGEKGAASEVAK